MNVIPMKKPFSQALECSECGAPGTGSCNCGAPYVTAGARAAKADAANPGKSARAIAAIAGVSEGTARRARGASYDAPAGSRVKGKDGKRYPAKGKPSKPTEDDEPDSLLLHLQEPCDGCDTNTEHWHHSLGLIAGEIIAMRAHWDRQFGKGWESFKVTSSVRSLARQALDEWTRLVKDLEKRK